MFQSFKFQSRSLGLAVSAALLLGSSVAHADLSYQQKLDALNQTVDVAFSLTLPFVKKAEGVNQLYHLVFESGCAMDQYFKKDGLIQRVVIHDAIGNDPQSVAARSLLRRHTILFDSSGSDSETLLREVTTFQTELNDIETIEHNLAQRIPSLLLDRTLSLVNQVTNPNRSYLANIRYLDTILNNVRYSAPLTSFGKVWIEDSASGSASTTIQTFSYQTMVNERYTSNKGLLLRFARDGFYQERSRVTPELIQQLLDVVLVDQFEQVDYTVLSEEEVRVLFNDFSHFLTPARIEKLKARGIHRFYFSNRWENEGDLIVGDRLTLGINMADMEKIYALLF